MAKKKGKGPAATLGRKGGKNRAKHLTKEQLSEQGRSAAKKRWDEEKKKKRP